VKVALLLGPLLATGEVAESIDLAAALRRREIDATVIAGAGPLASRLEAAGIPHELTAIGANFLSDLPEIPALRRAIAKRGPELLHVLDERLKRHASAATRLPQVLTVKRPGPVPHARGRRLVVGFRSVRDAMVLDHGAQPESVRTVEPGVDLSRIPPLREPFSGGKPVIGALGPLVPEAGLPDLLEAVKLLGAGERAVHLLVAGHGPGERSVRRRAREAGIAHHVTVAAPPREFERLLGSVDVLADAGTAERGGADLLQAMAAARPAVVAGVGSAFSLVREGETGFLVPRHDPSVLAAKIAWLIDHPDRAREMGAQARDRVASRFDVDSAAERLEDVYREMIE